MPSPSFIGLAAPAFAADPADPYLWLEDVQGRKALDWVKSQNRLSTQEIEAVPEYRPILKRCLEIYDSRDRIPMPAQEGAWLYNFWQDPAHERGILRRTTPASYRTASPEWETVLDIDALSQGRRPAVGLQGADLPAAREPPLHGRALRGRQRRRHHARVRHA